MNPIRPFLLLLFAASMAVGQPILRQPFTTNTLATNYFADFNVRNASPSLQMVPPLGYNSYIDNGTNITEGIVSNQIVLMKANGTTAKYKFRWINIDDGWPAAARDASGNLVANPAKFPSGISGVNQLAHTNGFKLIWYLAAGSFTAGNLPGSKGVMFQDVTNLYLRGADGVRVSNDDIGFDLADFASSSPNLYLLEQIFPAINMFSSPFYLSANVGQRRAWMQGAINSTVWTPGTNTTSGKTMFDLDGSQTNTIDLLDFYQPKTYLFGPRRFLDAVTTPTGHQITWANFNIPASRRVMSIFAMLHLPFWHSSFDMAASFKYTWTNDYMLDIHQDPLMAPCQVLSSNATVEILATPMANNKLAIGFYSRSYTTGVTNAATLYWTNDNLRLPSGPYEQFDVWNYSSFVNASNSFSIGLTNDQFALYILSPATVNQYAGEYYPSNVLTAANVLTGMTNGGSWVGMISNGLYGVWMSNNVATWKQLMP